MCSSRICATSLQIVANWDGRIAPLEEAEDDEDEVDVADIGDVFCDCICCCCCCCRCLSKSLAPVRRGEWYEFLLWPEAIEFPMADLFSPFETNPFDPPAPPPPLLLLLQFESIAVFFVDVVVIGISNVLG